MKQAKKKTGRGNNENSRKNLKPVQPGEVRNPTGVNGVRPYTDAIRLVANNVLPEQMRREFNATFKKKLKDGRVDPADKTPDILPEGATWADANALRLHLNAIVNGDVRAATEIREAVEGRATQRIEINRGNDRLKQLLDAFADMRNRPPVAPDPSSSPASSASKP